MAVPPSEGSHSIIYGAVPVLLGAGEFAGYLARPDGLGAWPSVILLPGARGIGSLEKALARHLARHGRSTLVPDPYRGRGPGPHATDEEVAAASAALRDQQVLADVGEAREYLSSDDTTWADDGPSAIVGVGAGGRFALLTGARRRDLSAVVAIAAPLGAEGDREAAIDAVGRISVPVLGLYGAEDEWIPLEDIDAAQAANPAARFIVYEGVGHAFIDPSSDDYHPGAEADALARIRATLDAVSPVPA